jgi:hypothetical protein
MTWEAIGVTAFLVGIGLVVPVLILLLSEKKKDE